MFVARYTSTSRISKAIEKLPLASGRTYTTVTTRRTGIPKSPAFVLKNNLQPPHHRTFTSSTSAMAPITAWKRLVRYVSAKDGSIKYGEPIVSEEKPDIDALAQKGGLKVKVLSGESPLLAKPTGEEDEVKQLLGPLTPKDVPIVRCVGLNYRTHSKIEQPLLSYPRTRFHTNAPLVLETGFDLPANPTLFVKPSHTVADTRAPVPIPSLGQPKCDYEGELTIVIGKDAKNVSEADALSYVAGYVTGNDVSCRDWQMDKDKAGMMPQWSFSKSFDKYAPLGPCIASTELLGDASGLKLTTFVNGEKRQESDTADLVFGVKKLVSFLSTGQTLQAGSLIMTGTPGGVGFGFKPPVWLKDGDEVVVSTLR